MNRLPQSSATLPSGLRVLLLSLLPTVLAFLSCSYRNEGARPDTSEWDFSLTHDFARVRPNAQVTHEFKVHNATEEFWTLEKVVETCACSVVKPKSDGIAAGQSQVFVFTYRAGDADREDRRSVLLRFDAGQRKATVTLTITSRIRHDLTVYPAKLDFGQVAAGSRVPRTIRLENYTSTNWHGVSIQSSIPEIQLVRIDETAQPAGTPLPRQVWTAEVLLTAGNLGQRSLHGCLSVRADAEESESQVPVVAHIIDDVTILPSVVSFGTIPPGVTVQRDLGVWVKGAHRDSFSPRDVSISNKTNHKLTFRWRESPQSPGCWILAVTLQPPDVPPGTIIAGTFALDFPSGMSHRAVSYTGRIGGH